MLAGRQNPTPKGLYTLYSLKLLWAMPSSNGYFFFLTANFLISDSSNASTIPSDVLNVDVTFRLE